MSAASNDWRGVVLAIAIIGIMVVFFIPRAVQQEKDGGFLLKILVAGLLLKLAFAFVRVWITFGIFGGVDDAAGYNHYGTIISQQIWHLEFGAVFQFLRWGTQFIDFSTGVIYSVVGPSINGGSLVYAFLGYLGSYYFYKAFRVAFPEGNKWLYAIMIFLFPSILYWANGIGKDAPIFFCIGLFSCGAAQLIKNQRLGFLPLALGLLGVLWIRPHVAAILLLAFGLAFFLPVAGKQRVRITTFVIVILVVVGTSWLILPRVASFIGLAELTPQGLIDSFVRQQGFTAIGSSAFQAIDFKNPLTYPMAIINLLFRPFPWEAHNIQALIASFEGLLLIGLILWRYKSIGKAIASSISNPYSRFIVIYSLAFIIAFSIVSNFGILSRERPMFLPFLLMLISYTPSLSSPRLEVDRKYIIRDLS
jgi:hypothetical protein